MPETWGSEKRLLESEKFRAQMGRGDEWVMEGETRDVRTVGGDRG